jgi:hypothetical protein
LRDGRPMARGYAVIAATPLGGTPSTLRHRGLLLLGDSTPTSCSGGPAPMRPAPPRPPNRDSRSTRICQDRKRQQLLSPSRAAGRCQVANQVIPSQISADGPRVMGQPRLSVEIAMPFKRCARRAVRHPDEFDSQSETP